MAKYPDVSPLVMRRLPRYYRCLTELESNGTHRISSREFAEIIGFTASQIRQDLNCFGGFGQQGYGYNVSTLRGELGRILSVEGQLPAIIIGAGNLGLALANHVDFEHCGFRFVGLFDINPAVIGKEINGRVVCDIASLPAFCRERKPLVAVLCVPPAAVPGLARRLVELGVESFWNFTQVDLSNLLHDTVLVEDVQLGDSLMTLSYRVNERLDGSK